MPESQSVSVAPTPLENDLFLILAGDEAAARRVYAECHPVLLRAAARHNRHLPEDLHAAVAGEAWSLLFELYSNGGAPAQSTAMDVLMTLLSRASDRVRSAHRLPNERARLRNLRRASADGGHRQLEVVMLDSESGAESVEVAREDEGYRQAEVRHDLEVLLRRAPADIAEVMSTVLGTDLSLSAAANQIGVERSRLQRWITSARGLAA